MSATPSPQNGTAPKRGPQLSRQTLVILIVAALLIVAAIIVVVALMSGSGDDADTNGAGATVAGQTNVTSPYDVYELPDSVGPDNVQEASLVSISLAKADGSTDYYGLSADTEPAKALMKAVADAEELEATDTTDDTGATDTSISADQATGSMLTFLFPDRTTLAFELDVAQGTIARGGHIWQVDGDLTALVDAAISLHGQQQTAP